jgi:transcriptional regulator with XRE-family HTH domain
MRNALREARTAKGWSQAELARKAELSYNTVAFAERGYMMSRKTAKILSRLLGAEIPPILSDARRDMLTRRYNYRKAMRERLERECQEQGRAGSTVPLVEDFTPRDRTRI